MTQLLTAAQIRQRLSFDVGRVQRAGARVVRVDRDLCSLKHALEARARHLSGEATKSVAVEMSDARLQVRYAQAQATAALARRATWNEILSHGRRLSLIASMAVTRWIQALTELGQAPASTAVIKGHIDAGRLAHRLMAVWSPRAGLLSGCGQLAAALVVAEFIHPDNQPYLDEQLEEGLQRGYLARGVRGADDIFLAVSSALRLASELLEGMADEAEPAARVLLAEAQTVEADVAARLVAGRPPSRK